jgi:DNA-binding CsgD family transcriptional regulator
MEFCRWHPGEMNITRRLKMKMIKLAVGSCDEKYLQQLTNRLHEEKDINLLGTIIINNLKSEVKQATAFVKQMIEQRPDILLFDQFILLEVASLNLEKLGMLSPREMEVLALISESMTNEEIASKLFLSSKTVKTHLRNIFAKAEIRNRVEAALLYTRHTLMLQ